MAFSVPTLPIAHIPRHEPRSCHKHRSTTATARPPAVAACDTAHVPVPISDIPYSKRGTMNPHPPDIPESACPPEISVIELRGRSFEDHQEFVPALLETMASCGCWLLERRELPPNATELRFEILLRSVFELYSGLLTCGVELSRDSHTSMKSLCTVRDHNPHRARRRRVLSVRLELIFVDEPETPSSTWRRTATGRA